MMDAGLIVLTAFISPFEKEREMSRNLIGKDNFIEVYVNTSREICEERDPKDLYKKARMGEISNMTGINSPYEAPNKPDYDTKTQNNTIDLIVSDLSEMVYLKAILSINQVPKAKNN